MDGYNTTADAKGTFQRTAKPKGRTLCGQPEPDSPAESPAASLFYRSVKMGAGPRGR